MEVRVVPRVVTMSEHIARAGPSTAPHQQFPAHINNNVANNHGGGPGHGHPPPNMLPSPDTINTRLARDSDEKLPFKVEYREGVGNFVVASRDIRPNEVRIYGFMASSKNYLKKSFFRAKIKHISS